MYFFWWTSTCAWLRELILFVFLRQHGVRAVAAGLVWSWRPRTSPSLREVRPYCHVTALAWCGPATGWRTVRGWCTGTWSAAAQIIPPNGSWTCLQEPARGSTTTSTRDEFLSQTLPLMMATSLWSLTVRSFFIYIYCLKAFRQEGFCLKTLIFVPDVVSSDKGIYSCNLHHHYCQIHQSIQIQLNVTKSGEAVHSRSVCKTERKKKLFLEAILLTDELFFQPGKRSVTGTERRLCLWFCWAALWLCRASTAAPCGGRGSKRTSSRWPTGTSRALASALTWLTAWWTSTPLESGGTTARSLRTGWAWPKTPSL